MSVSDLMSQMAEAGAPIEAIIIAVKAIESREAKAAERRAQAAERKRRQRASSQDESVTVTRQSPDADETVEGQSEDNPLDKESFPHTPFKEIKPLTPVSPKGDTAPIADEPVAKQVRYLVEAWNDLAEEIGLAKVVKMDNQRRRRAATLVKNNSAEDIGAALAAIYRNRWMHGENDRGWRADFDFLLQPKSFTKLIEGSYDRA